MRRWRTGETGSAPWLPAPPLVSAVWDAHTVRDDLRSYVVYLGDEAGVLVVDETGSCAEQHDGC